MSFGDIDVPRLIRGSITTARRKRCKALPRTDNFAINKRLARRKIPLRGSGANMQEAPDQSCSPFAHHLWLAHKHPAKGRLYCRKRFVCRHGPFAGMTGSEKALPLRMRHVTFDDEAWLQDLQSFSHI